MADPRFSIIPADDNQYDESRKLALLATRPDSIDYPAEEDRDGDDGSGLAALMASCDGRCWYHGEGQR